MALNSDYTVYLLGWMDHKGVAPYMGGAGAYPSSHKVKGRETPWRWAVPRTWACKSTKRRPLAASARNQNQNLLVVRQQCYPLYHHSIQNWISASFQYLCYHCSILTYFIWTKNNPKVLDFNNIAFRYIDLVPPLQL